MGYEESARQLIPLLTADFTPCSAQLNEAGASSVRVRLHDSHSNRSEGVRARATSAENHELGREVDALLESAPVTATFKMFITNAVRRAHARQAAVEKTVSPNRLGLLVGSGIFDPKQAQVIEAEGLKRLFDDIIQMYVDEPADNEPAQGRPAVKNPAAYLRALVDVMIWEGNFVEQFGFRPFGGPDLEKYVAAVADTRRLRSEDGESESVVKAIERLWLRRQEALSEADGREPVA